MNKETTLKPISQLPESLVNNYRIEIKSNILYINSPQSVSVVGAENAVFEDKGNYIRIIVHNCTIHLFKGSKLITTTITRP